MDFLLLANRKAGAVDDDLVDRVRRRLARSGRVDVIAMVGNDTAGVARQHPGARLVVLGGDGTLHVAVQELWEGGELGAVELALVPTGTGNDFARGVGIPLAAEPAAALAATGTARPVDVITGDGIVAVNAIHAGIGAEAARLAQPLKAVAGPAAYPLGATAAGVTETGWEVTVTADGAQVGRAGEPVLMVGICNAPSIGGGTRLCPAADPADGVLDLVVATATGPLDRAGYAVALRRGEHVDRDDVAHVQAREVTISGDPMRYDVDGEIGEPQATASWRIEPGAVRIVRP